MKTVGKRSGRYPGERKSGFAVINAALHGGIATLTGCSARQFIISNVPIVGKNSIFMGTSAGSTAAMRVISQTVLKAVVLMTKEEFRNEKLYQTTMHLARKMLEEGIISEEEYRQIDTIFLEKYKPVFGTLFSDISLTSGA